MYYTTEEMEAYMTVARLEILKRQKVTLEIKTDPMLPAYMLGFEMYKYNYKPTLEELKAYATVAICELRRVNALLDEAIADMSKPNINN